MIERRMPIEEARIASEQDELQFRYRFAVDALEALRDSNSTRSTRCDDEIDWSPIAEYQCRLRDLAEEITGDGRHREDRAA